VGAAALALAAALVGLPAHATTFIRFEKLPALVAESERAVLATVTSVTHRYDARGLHATFVELQVEDSLYGAAAQEGATLTIKLYGSPEPMADGSRMYVEGTPRYRVTERYLLLLRGESPWGFTNTAGLMQGAFRVDSEEDGGRLMAVSLGGNRSVLGPSGLGQWLSPTEVDAGQRRYLDVTEGGIPYELLRQAVVKLRQGGAR
jgi:hypothetical protein